MSSDNDKNEHEHEHVHGLFHSHAPEGSMKLAFVLTLVILSLKLWVD